MKIWVDADACPVAVREILFRAAKRTSVLLILVANHRLPAPKMPNIEHRVVSSGFDVADNAILDEIEPGDVVITADIPLAAEAMEKGAKALHPRGERYDPETIRAKLNMRDFMDTMRASGVHTGGPPPLSGRDKKEFADNLDRLLAQSLARKS